jgi:hypothetical protein
LAKTIAIDNVQLQRVALVRDGGDIHLVCEYALRAGSQVVQIRHGTLEPPALGMRRGALHALFDAIARDLADQELG